MITALRRSNDRPRRRATRARASVPSRNGEFRKCVTHDERAGAVDLKQSDSCSRKEPDTIYTPGVSQSRKLRPIANEDTRHRAAAG